MSIVIVGGHDRLCCRYKTLCERYGCQCKVFTQCPSNLKTQIGSPDMLIIFTQTVSHKMVTAASQQAKRTGAIVKHCHSSSMTALGDCLEAHFCAAAT